MLQDQFHWTEGKVLQGLEVVGRGYVSGVFQLLVTTCSHVLDLLLHLQTHHSHL